MMPKPLPQPAVRTLGAIVVAVLVASGPAGCGPADTGREPTPEERRFLESIDSNHTRSLHTDPAFPPIETLFNLDGLTVPREQVLRGPKPKDGIPALTDPKTVPVAEAAFLRPDSRVVGITIGGESRAYPINVLNFHEVINDQLGGTDLAVTYCVLCDSVTVVDRRLDGETLTFGVAGLIYQSNLLLYDKADQALWSQMTTTAISGPKVGRSLVNLEGWEVTRLDAWRSAHPDSTVVAYPTGYTFDYDSDPSAASYATDDLDRQYQDLPGDPRLRNRARVIGVRVGDSLKAYPLNTLRSNGEGLVEDSIGGGKVVFRVGPTEGSVGVESAPDGALVIHTFWFAWVARFPQTELYVRPGS